MTLITVVWIVCLVEVLVIGFGVDQMHRDNAGLCVFMGTLPDWVLGVRALVTLTTPLLMLFICGFLFIGYSCKARKTAFEHQKIVPLILMCILTPLIHLPSLIFNHIDASIPMMRYSDHVRDISWILLPLYFLCFGEIKTEGLNTCRKCCKRSEESESIGLMDKD